MAGSFASGVGCLGDLRPMREISPDQRVENLGRRGNVGRSRRAFALTVDALNAQCIRATVLSSAKRRVSNAAIVRDEIKRVDSLIANARSDEHAPGDGGHELARTQGSLAVTQQVC